MHILSHQSTGWSAGLLVAFGRVRKEDSSLVYLYKYEQIDRILSFWALLIVWEPLLLFKRQTRFYLKILKLVAVVSMDAFTQLYSHYQEDSDRQGGEDRAEHGAYTSKFIEVTEIVSPSGDQLEVFEDRDTFRRKRTSHRQFDNVSLLLRRIYTQDLGAKPKAQLEIQSDILRTAFWSFPKERSSVDFYDDRVVIDEPYHDLYHYWDHIAYRIGTGTEEERREFLLLKKFKDDYMSGMVEKIEALIAKVTITYEYLWALFAPGTLVILENATSPIKWCVIAENFKAEVRNRKPIWTITASHLGFDGETVGMVQKDFIFQGFEDAREIRTLLAYPISYNPKRDELMQYFIERGRKYQRFLGVTHCMYNGPFWNPRKDGVIEPHRYYDSSPVEVSKYSCNP